MNPSYIALTAYDAVIQGQPTFETRKDAIAWAEENREVFPGLRVVRVIHPPPQVTTLWRDRLVRLVAA